MAKDKLTEYDATANNNTVVGDVNLAENSMNPSDVNNALREIMSHQKEAFGAGTPLYVDQTNNRVGVNKTPTVALDVSGNANISGNIDVDGVTNLDVVDIDGAVDMASTLTVNGGDGITIQTSSDTFLQLKTTGTTANNFIEFKDSGGSSGNITYNHASNFLSTKVNGSERMRIHSTGLVSIGNTSANAMLNITNNYPYTGVRTNSNTAVAHWAMEFHNSNGKVGDILTQGSGTTFNSPSDYRLKENIVDMSEATSRLKQLQPRNFNFKADADAKFDGFIAHEVQAIVPEAISGEKDAVDADGKAVMQGIDQSKLVPLLVKTIQELEARITVLEGA